MEIKSVYLAGKMSGIKHHNFPEFFRITKLLENTGLHVENPANNDGVTLEEAIHNSTYVAKGAWEDYMKIDVRRVVECDAVVVLPGWQKSRGANLEVHLARQLAMPVLRFDEKENKLKQLVEIVALSGFAGSGKDEAARQLKEFGWHRKAFADILRNCLYALNPITIRGSAGIDFPFLQDLVDEQGWQEAKTNNPDVRRLLQRLGTEAGRDILGKNIWINTLMNSLDDGQKYIFCDCRFENEAQAVKEYGGKVIRIHRPGVGPLNDHPSENSLNDYKFDYEVNNDSTPENLGKLIMECLS